MENIVRWGNKELVINNTKDFNAIGGRLSKYWLEDKKSGRIFLIKGSTTFGYEPFCEKIAYIIGKNLGMDILEYDVIPSELFKGSINIKTNCKYVSICEKIDRNGYFITSVAEIKRAQNVIRKLNNEPPKSNREVMYEMLPQKYIDTMILFDAIIGNNDRHYGNVHLLRSNDGEILAAPILDNGSSCLANENMMLAYLLNYKVGEKIDRSSTFADKHSKQIMNATTLNGINFDIPIKTMQILSELEPVFELMPKRRSEITKKFIIYRLHKFLSIIKNSEIPELNMDLPIDESIAVKEKEHT